MKYEYFKKLYDFEDYPYSIIRRESYTYNYWFLYREKKWLKMEWEPEEFDQMMKDGRVIRIDKEDEAVVGFLMMQELTEDEKQGLSYSELIKELC